MPGSGGRFVLHSFDLGDGSGKAEFTDVSFVISQSKATIPLLELEVALTLALSSGPILYVVS